jgi:hypothetical protein
MGCSADLLLIDCTEEVWNLIERLPFLPWCSPEVQFRLLAAHAIAVKVKQHIGQRWVFQDYHVRDRLAFPPPKASVLKRCLHDSQRKG